MNQACEQCGAELAFAGVRTEICPYCASPNVSARDPAPDRPTPRFVVAFAHDAAHAKVRLDAWLGSRWFADTALRDARVHELRGIYVPAYLYSAVAHTRYSAWIGEHYTETEQYEETDAEGKKVTKTRLVTRTEHRQLAGRHVGYITDVVVSASKGLTNRELAAIEPFDMRQLRRFEPAIISGWIAEEFSRSVAECTRSSRAEARDVVGARLRGFMPGDSYSDLESDTAVEWESLEPVLVPVWVLAVRYRDDRPVLRVVINGQTGAVTGRPPRSWWKIALASTAVATVIAAIVYLVMHR